MLSRGAESVKYIFVFIVHKVILSYQVYITLSNRRRMFIKMGLILFSLLHMYRVIHHFCESNVICHRLLIYSWFKTLFDEVITQPYKDSSQLLFQRDRQKGLGISHHDYVNLTFSPVRKEMLVDLDFIYRKTSIGCNQCRI